MIGLSTMLVRTADGKCHAHRFGGYLHHSNWLTLTHQQQYDDVSKNVAKWDERGYDGENISEAEILMIANAHTDNRDREVEGYYHKLAGDGVYMLNHQDKTLKHFNRTTGVWDMINVLYFGPSVDERAAKESNPNVIPGDILTSIIQIVGASEITLVSGEAVRQMCDDTPPPKVLCTIKYTWKSKDFGPCTYVGGLGGENATEALKASLQEFGRIVFTEEEEQSETDLTRGLRSAVKRHGLTTVSLQQIINAL